MSNAEITALGSKPVQVRIFEEAGSNYALWLKEVANDQLARELQEMVRVLLVFYRATLPTARKRKCTVALLFDMVDFMMDLATDFVTEQADCQRANRSIKVTYELMQKHFPDLNFSMEEMQQPLPIVARKLCLLHRQELSQVNWPQEAWKCQCSWHPRLKRALDAFEEDSVPSNENLSLTRGLVPRAAQSAGQQSRPKKVGAGGCGGDCRR